MGYKGYGHFNQWNTEYNSHPQYPQHPQDHHRPHFTFPTDNPTKTGHDQGKVDDIVTTIKNIAAEVATNITESIATTTETIQEIFTTSFVDTGNVINTVTIEENTNSNQTMFSNASEVNNTFTFNEDTNSNRTILVALTESSDTSILTATENMETVLTDILNTNDATSIITSNNDHSNHPFLGTNNDETVLTSVTDAVETITTTISDAITTTANEAVSILTSTTEKVNEAVSILTTTTEKVITSITNIPNTLTSSTTVKLDWTHDENDILMQAEPHYKNEDESHQSLYIILGVILAILILIVIVLLLIYMRYKKNNCAAKYQYEITPIAGTTSFGTKCIDPTLEAIQCTNEVFVQEIK